MTLITLFIIASAADLLLTIYGLQIGMIETNPLVAGIGYSRMVIFKIATVAAAVGVYAIGAEMLEFTALWSWIWRVLVALVWLVVLWNTANILLEVAPR